MGWCTVRSRITIRDERLKQSDRFSRGFAARAALIAATFCCLCAVRLNGQAASAPKPSIALQSISPALSFEKTAGSSEAQFTARTRRGSLVLAKNSAVLTLGRKSRGKEPQVRLQFDGASPQPVISGEQELPGKIYYADANTRGPLQGNPTFRRVRYSQLYRGVDAV